MNRNISVVGLLAAVAMLVSSCMEANGPDYNTAVASADSLKLSISKNTITASWKYSDDVSVDQFVTQLATDKNFNAVIQTDTLSPNKREIVYEDATVSTEYYFRFRAIPENIAKESPFVMQSLILEDLLKSPAKTDQIIIGKKVSVIFLWDAPTEGTVTNLVIQPEGGSKQNIELTQEQISNQKISIGDLQSATAYTATLYDGDIRKGAVSFKTLDTSALIYINDGERSYLSLQSAINDASTGDVIRIKGQHNFEGTDINVDKNLTIRAFDDVEEQPKMTLDGFNISDNVKELDVSGLRMIGTGDYLFSLDGGSSVVVKDCNISAFKVGLYEAGSGAYKFIMDNSLIHDFEIPDDEAAGVFELSGGQPDNFDITNSTFWNMASSFIHASDDVAYQGYDINYPLIDHCTFNDIAAGKFTYIRSNNTFRLRINNSILTNKKSDVVNAMLVLAYANNSVASGDYSKQFFKFFFGGTSNILDVDPMYADPANGDFTLANQKLIEKGWGDPRWLP